MHARAGAQQGLFTGDDPIWLPFPMASVAAALLAVLGAGAALVKRDVDRLRPARRDVAARRRCSSSTRRRSSTARGTGPASCARRKSPILRMYDTADGRAVHGQPERHGALARAVPAARARRRRARLLEPEGLAKLSDREWNRAMLDESSTPLRRQDRRRVGGGAARSNRPRSPSATRWRSGSRTSRRAPTRCSCVETDPGLGRSRLVGPPMRDRADGAARGPAAGTARSRARSAATASSTCRASGPGPLAARLLAELGADVVKVEPPGGEGGFQLMPVLPNIYVDGNRSKRGLVARPQGRRGPGAACSTWSPRPTSWSRTRWRARGSASGSTRRSCGR